MKIKYDTLLNYYLKIEIYVLIIKFLFDYSPKTHLLLISVKLQ